MMFNQVSNFSRIANSTKNPVLIAHTHMHHKKSFFDHAHSSFGSLSHYAAWTKILQLRNKARDEETDL